MTHPGFLHPMTFSDSSCSPPTTLAPGVTPSTNSRNISFTNPRTSSGDLSPLDSQDIDSDPWSLIPFSESPRVPSTELRVVDTSVDSVTLAWTPVSGVSSYILSWRPLRRPGQGEVEAKFGMGWQLGFHRRPPV